MILVFIILNAVLISSRVFLEKKGIDQGVVIMGNLLLFVVSVIAFILTRKSIDAPNPHTFVRAVYTGFIIKFFLVVIAAFIYFQSVEQVSKPALFAVMFLYLVYTFLEVSSLLRLMKGQKNG